MSRALAHAFGERYDLPVPLLYFVVGGGLAVLVSFFLVLRTPTGSGKEATDEGAASAGPRVGPGAWFALVLTAILVAGGLAGASRPELNILSSMFWIVGWVVVPISCGLIGDWTRPLNPFRAVSLMADSRRGRRLLLSDEEPVSLPAWIGAWPSVVAFIVVISGELIYNGTATQPGFTAAAIVVYALVNVLGSFVLGADAWLEIELFSRLYRTWGCLGFFRFGSHGQRGLGGGLPRSWSSVSAISFVSLLLVGVAFDGVLSTAASRSLRLTVSLDLGRDFVQAATLLSLVLFLGLAWIALLAFAKLTVMSGKLSLSTGEAVGHLLPSLVPISLGYQLAHYLYYIVLNLQRMVPLLRDPFGLHWALLPEAFTTDVKPLLLPAKFVWYAQILIIVSVHVWALVIAHRRLGQSAPEGRLARRAEWPWTAAMVGYTMTSLWLLAQPIVGEAAS